MADSLQYDGIKWFKGSVAKVTDPLAVEKALQININGESFTVVMQTPGAEKELVYGLLYGEDVLKKDSVFELEFERNKHDNEIELVNLICDQKKLGKGYLSSRSLLSVSSCGICGKRELTPMGESENGLAITQKITVDDIRKIQDQLFVHQELFKTTGGCHGVAAFNSEGKMLALFEDVGRHNALDKVVGKLLFDKTLGEATVIAFSGRISYEIVSKCFRAKIPVIIAVSASTSLAVDFAKEFGITLLGFARENKFTCYAVPERIEGI